jgi:hypothetical protein
LKTQIAEKIIQNVEKVMVGKTEVEKIFKGRL